MENGRWKDILSQPWIWTDARCPFHAITAELFAEHGCRPDRAVVADEDSTIKNLVLSGVGLGLMTATEARESAGAGELFILRGDRLQDSALLHLPVPACRGSNDTSYSQLYAAGMARPNGEPYDRGSI